MLCTFVLQWNVVTSHQYLCIVLGTVQDELCVNDTFIVDTGEAACSALLIVTEKMEPPQFTQKPMNIDVKEGVKATFDAKVNGKPLPEITV